MASTFPTQLCFVLLVASWSGAAYTQEAKLDDLERQLEAAKRVEAAKKTKQKQAETERIRIEAQKQQEERERAERLAAEETAAAAEAARARELAITGGCSLDQFRYASVRIVASCQGVTGMVQTDEYTRTSAGQGMTKQHSQFSSGNTDDRVTTYRCAGGRVVATSKFSGYPDVEFNVVEPRVGETISNANFNSRVISREVQNVLGNSVEVAVVEWQGSDMNGTSEILVGAPNVFLNSRSSEIDCQLTQLTISE